MKKLLYIALLVFSVAVSFTACTEEEVTPTNETANGGGGGSVDPIKG